MRQLAKSVYNFLDSISNEISYWAQIQKLKTELETTRNQLAVVNEQNYKQIIEIADLTNKLEDACREAINSKAAYQSLLFDYFEMAKKYRTEKCDH